MTDHQTCISVQKLIVVPCRSVGVHEYVDVGELIVEIDDVAEIDHDFVTFVLGRTKLCIFPIVDRVHIWRKEA